MIAGLEHTMYSPSHARTPSAAVHISSNAGHQFTVSETISLMLVSHKWPLLALQTTSNTSTSELPLQLHLRPG